MKIKKNSFWFWLHESWGSGEYHELEYRGHAVSLCPYFWKGCSILVFYVVCALAVTAVALFLLSMLFTLLVSPYLGIWLNNFIVTFNIMCWMVALIATILFGIVELLPASIKGDIPWIPTYISKYFPEWKSKEKKYRKMSEPEKQPNILVQYIKAKKSKWCPLIELEE